MAVKSCTLSIWMILLPCTLGSTLNQPLVSTIEYQKTDRNLLLGCEENAFAIEDQWSVFSCAISCKHSLNCSAIGYKDSRAPENCLLISSYHDVVARLSHSHAGYDYFFVIAENSTTAATTTTNSSTWMLFQRRVNGKIDFFRNWTEYKNGFGDHCEFWIGNDKLHELTKDGEYRLRIELEDNDGVMAAAEWDTFIVGDEQSKYQLTVGGFNGADPPGDSMAFHNGMKFTTLDADNDEHLTENCGSYYEGGWWFRQCHYAYLNGKYGSVGDWKGLIWYHWKGGYYSLSASRMMIKKKQS